MFRKIDFTKPSSASSIIKGIKRSGKECNPATLQPCMVEVLNDRA
jgi:hypothetical protein